MVAQARTFVQLLRQSSKATDIRGIYPTDLNEGHRLRDPAAFATFLQPRNRGWSRHAAVVASIFRSPTAYAIKA